jgi:hypothetical protein
VAELPVEHEVVAARRSVRVTGGEQSVTVSTEPSERIVAANGASRGPMLGAGDSYSNFDLAAANVLMSR